MKCIDRYHRFKDEPFDLIITKIHNGTIKCGRYAHKVKVDENKLLKRKEFLK